jgi:aspartate/methionine/tyrosine aminotransferase
MLNKAIGRMSEIDPSRFFQDLPEDLINLTFGEPMMPVFPHIQEAITAAIAGQTYTLPPIRGIAELREKAADNLRRVNGINCNAENILITNGVHEGLGLTCAALLEPGDEIIVFKPDFPMYKSMAEYFDCNVVYVTPDYQNGMSYDLSGFDDLFSEKTKAVFLNTPQNPSGVVFPEADIRQIVAACQAHQVYLLSDEVYEKLVFEIPHFSAGAAEAEPELVFTLHSFSKGYALSGLRVGYLCADKSIVDKIANLKTDLSFSTNVISQKAALAALQTPQDIIDGMVSDYRDKRDTLMQCFDDLDISYVKPQGAFFVMADFSRFGDDEVGQRKLLDKTGILTFPGSFFGADPGYQRFSYSATSEDIDAAVESLRTRL